MAGSHDEAGDLEGEEEEAGAEDDGWIYLTLESSVQEMGWVSSAMAPERMFIEEIIEGSWAEEAGLQRADELFSVGGTEVIELDEASYLDALEDRPVELVFYHFTDTALGYTENADGELENGEENIENTDGELENGEEHLESVDGALGNAEDEVESHHSEKTSSLQGKPTESKVGSQPNTPRSHGSSQHSKSSKKDAADDDTKSSARKAALKRSGSQKSEAQESSARSHGSSQRSNKSKGPGSDRESESGKGQPQKAVRKTQQARSSTSSAPSKEAKAKAAAKNTQKADIVDSSKLPENKGRAASPREGQNPQKTKASAKSKWKAIKVVAQLRACSKERKEAEKAAQAESVKFADGSPEADQPLSSKLKAALQTVGFAVHLSGKRKPKNDDAHNTWSPSQSPRSKVGVAGMKFVAKEIVVAKKEEAVRVDHAEQEFSSSQFDVNAQNVWLRNRNQASESDLDVQAWRKKVTTAAAKTKARAKRRPASAENFDRLKGLEIGWTPSGRARSILMSKRDGFAHVALKGASDIESKELDAQSGHSAQEKTPEQKWEETLEKREKEMRLHDKKLDKKLKPDVERRVDFWFGEDLDEVTGIQRDPRIKQHILEKEHKTEEAKVRQRALEKLHNERMTSDWLLKDAANTFTEKELAGLTDHLNFYLGFAKTKTSDEKREEAAALRKQQAEKNKLDRKVRAVLRYKGLLARKTVHMDMEQLRKLGLNPNATAEELQALLEKMQREHEEYDEDAQHLKEALNQGTGMNARRETIAQVDDNDGNLRKAYMSRVEKEYGDKSGTVLDELLNNLKHPTGKWEKKDPEHGVMMWDDAELKVTSLELTNLAAVTKSVMTKYHNNIPVPLAHSFKKSLALVCMIMYTKTDVDIDRLLGFRDVRPLPKGFELPALRDSFYKEYREMAKLQGRNPQMFQDANWGTRIAWEGSVDDENPRTLEGWEKMTRWVKWICLLGVMSEHFKPPRTVSRGLTGLPDSILENFKNKKPGETIFWPALSSTTEDSSISWHYCNQQEPVEKNAVFTIRKVTEGLEISRVSQYPNEKELLLPPFSLLEVVNVKHGPGKPVELDCKFLCCDLSPSFKEKCEQEFKRAAKLVDEAETKLKQQEKEREEAEKTARRLKQKVTVVDSSEEESSGSEYDGKGYKIKKNKKKKKKKKGGDNEDDDDDSDTCEQTNEKNKKKPPKHFRIKEARAFWAKWERLILGYLVKDLHKTARYVEHKLKKETATSNIDLGANFTFVPWEEYPGIWSRWRITPHLKNDDKKFAFRPASNVSRLPLGMSDVSVSDHHYGPLPLSRVQSAPGKIGADRSDTRTSTSTQRPSTIPSRRSTLTENRRSTLRFAPGV